MTCEVVRTQLSGFIDKALTEAVVAEVREHIGQCRSCRETYGALYSADEFYSAVTKQKVPDDYRNSLRRRLNESVAAETRTN
jgi:predicted anti-sigma-YlaC factor YlaD